MRTFVSKPKTIAEKREYGRNIKEVERDISFWLKHLKDNPWCPFYDRINMEIFRLVETKEALKKSYYNSCNSYRFVGSDLSN